jgi:hypothetical protein
MTVAFLKGSDYQERVSMVNDPSTACGERLASAHIVADYLELPGLNVTLLQACRLWNLDAPECARLLNNLLARGFLRKSGDRYERARSGCIAA